MSPVALAAHFDGQQIVLDEPYELQPNTLLTVVVRSAQDDEDRADWLRLSMQNFAAGYGEDELEYSLDDNKEWNPHICRTTVSKAEVVKIVLAPEWIRVLLQLA